jgi:hypothetical protein
MDKLLTSAIVKNQLPNFVRDDYPTFVTFLEKYYEWLETNNQISYEIDALRSSNDIDTADSFYIEKLKLDLMPYFPANIVADKKLFLKLVTQFYKTNGTQESVKFLFRALYNENIDIYYPKDDILKTSDGKWTLPLALRIDTSDNNIFNMEKTVLTGQTSKATSVVEKVIQSVDRQLGITYTEVYISNIQRLYKTGETVSATYKDSVTGLDVTVSGRLIGSLSEIKIDPNNRGLFYNAHDVNTGYAGDPVTLVSGLNPDSANPIGAVAYVGETTKGGVASIVVSNGGFGFRDPVEFQNSSIVGFNGGFENVTLGTEATAEISFVDQLTYRTMNVSTTTLETLGSKIINSINANTISTITEYDSFNVYPIASVTLTGSGGGYRTKPATDIYSFYRETDSDVLVGSSGTTFNIQKNTNFITSSDVDLSLYFEIGDLARVYVKNKFEEIYAVSDITSSQVTFTQFFANDVPAVSLYKILRRDIRNLGSLGRISIDDGGHGYAVNEYLTFTGGTGYGANAKITEVHSGNNGIKAITFNPTTEYVLGGEGYKPTSLPTVSVNTVSGANSILTVMEVTGDGEKLDLSTTKIGAISKLRILSYGYDYVSAPTISLRNMDVVVKDVSPGQLFVSNTAVYQGSSNTNTTFKARVDTYVPATGLLRLYGYTGSISNTAILSTDDNLVTANVVSYVFYGDGRAKATAKFENGLIRYPGIYLNTDGQISADKRLQDGTKYHNFSYVISSSTDYSKFKKALNDVVHPIGTKTFVVRVDDNHETISESNSTILISINSLIDTFNIAYNGNTIISTNSTANLISTINVGDVIILSNVHKRLQNTVNVVSGSNVLFGDANSVNFINDFQDGDTIYLSTGNTTTIKSVTNSHFAILNTTINVTSTSALINVVYDDAVTANSVNANTVVVLSKMKANGTFLTATIQKVR